MLGVSCSEPNGLQNAYLKQRDPIRVKEFAGKIQHTHTHTH